MYSLTVAGQRRTLTGFAFSALASGPWAPLTFDIQLPALYRIGVACPNAAEAVGHPNGIRYAHSSCPAGAYL